MTTYVAGLMFRPAPTDSSETEIALIQKTHPEWQKGKLNGIGGHVMDGELVGDAMIREFREETGCITVPEDWRHFCTLGGRDWQVIWFVCLTGEGREVGTMEEEQVFWVPMRQLFEYQYDPRLQLKFIPNLRWLIPLALDKDKVSADVADFSGC